MSKEIEIIKEYLNQVRQKSPDFELIKIRREKVDQENFGIEKRNRKIEEENINKFNELGIINLFREISDEKLVIQDDSLKKLSGITKAEYKFGRHFKKISLLFDNYKGSEISRSEFGNRITVSLPFNNGINIHGFNCGERITRERIEFEGKNNEEIKAKIALTTAKFIAELQGYTQLPPERVFFDQI